MLRSCAPHVGFLTKGVVQVEPTPGGRQMWFYKKICSPSHRKLRPATPYVRSRQSKRCSTKGAPSGHTTTSGDPPEGAVILFERGRFRCKQQRVARVHKG